MFLHILNLSEQNKQSLKLQMYTSLVKKKNQIPSIFLFLSLNFHPTESFNQKAEDEK